MKSEYLSNQRSHYISPSLMNKLSAWTKSPSHFLPTSWAAHTDLSNISTSKDSEHCPWRPGWYSLKQF